MGTVISVVSAISTISEELGLGGNSQHQQTGDLRMENSKC
jgi:hypothetical protein